MENKIVLNFKNIVSEIESKELKLCFLKNNVTTMLVVDKQNNMYMIETYYNGGHLNSFIQNGSIVEFNLIDASISKDIPD